MTEAEDKAKAEKIAAAKKRVEELKKKNATSKKKVGKKDEKKQAGPSASIDDASSAAVDEGSPPPSKEKEPSLAEKSKMRSQSFRGDTVPTSLPLVSSSANPLSPGETAPDIYRKHVARIEELEKENKRLSREASDANKRWKKAEEDLAARDEDTDSEDDSDNEELKEVISKLENEVLTLRRQNAQLQSQARSRHGSSPSVSGSQLSETEALLKSKASQIETMELEISRLRAQISKPPPTSENEQVIALEEKLARAETTAAKAKTELLDLRKSFDKTAEKAVREGSGRSSAETAAANATRDAEAARAERDEAIKKAEALDKKVTTMVALHKEQDSRMQTLRKEKETLSHEANELRGRLAITEKRLAIAKSGKGDPESEKLGEGGGLDDEGVDELEAEERARLNNRIRDLEAENYELRRGIWHDRRKSMQVGPEDQFQDVDLGGGLRSPLSQRKGFTELFTSGINAITGADAYQAHQSQQQNMGFTGMPVAGAGARLGPADGVGDDGLLDDDLEFDEDAFKAAQQEEMARRLDRVKEAKRALKNWEDFKLDLVEARKCGGEGVGEIFEL